MVVPRRASVALLCSLTLALPARAAAAAPEDDLSERASEHVIKAIRLFNSGDYASSEAEFKRAEFFSPKWRAIHFNLAVVAEAQGKLGTAITEYKKFKPNASPDEDDLVNQRLFELNDRRKKIGKSYKSQIAAGAGAMAASVALLGVGGLFVGLYINNNNKISSLKAENENLSDTLAMQMMNMQETTLTQSIIDANSAKITDREGNKTKLLYGAMGFLIAGLVIAAYAAIPLSKAIRAKKQLDGLALGPSRLQWTGGLGARLRF